MNGEKRKRRLAAIVSADVVGYARLMSRDEDAALDALRAIRQDLIDPGAAEHGGRIVKTMGDGVLLEFSSAAEAVGFSTDLQRAMAKRGGPVVFRIGVNVGDVITEDGDIFGDGVNIAARLESIADPGGVCVSDDVLRLVAGRMEIDAEDMGERALKNIETPVRAHRIRMGLPAAAKPASEQEAVPAPMERPSLAIMPFRHLGGDPDTEFVTDGIALGVQTLLVQLSNIFFVNACLHTGYREGRQTAAEALADMPVRYALEGAVRQSGRKVRVQARVSDVTTGALVWAETYDRDLRDVFALEDEIARNIAGGLSGELIGGPVARDFTGGLTDPKAWEFFLRGLNFFYRWSEKNTRAAIEQFHLLAEVSPESGIAANYLSVLHHMAERRGWTESPEQAMAEARRWAERGVAMKDGNNGLAHAVLGSIALAERRHDESLRLCREAVAYRANCPFALERFGAARLFSGDPGGGVKYLREAMAVRVFRMPPLVNTLALAYRDGGELGLSIAAAEEALRADATYVDALATLCTDHALNGDEAAASAAAARLVEAAPGFGAAAYAAAQPYRDPERAVRVERALIGAGVPA